MNATRLTILIVLISLLLSACSVKAEPATVVEVNKTVEVEVEVVEQVAEEAAPAEQPVAVMPLPTQAPLVAEPAVQPTPADMFFQDYGVNPYIDTMEDHLSTFALDVDTASYSLARNYLNDGNLPPADAIRVEEFVNYFNMEYPTPPDVAFGIYADGAPSPFQYDGTQILRIGVQGYEVAEWERKASTLTFVIDVSGSMDMENRLGLVKQSLEMLVDRLRPDDTVAIIVYGSEARAVLYPTRGDDHNTILNAIYSLRPEGSTNAEAGLRLGYQVAMQYYRSGTNNRVILCSDGVANVGETGPDAILSEIRGYVSEGIYLTTVGFGMGNFNDVLMEQLANDGNGSYAYVDDLDEANKLFVENLTSTLQVIARDARVQIDFNADVVAYYRLIGYENRAIADQDFRNDYIDAGEIGAGHSVTALYAVQMRPGAEGRIATIQMRWEDPDTYEVREINGNFNTWDLYPSFEEADPHYQLAVLVSQFAELLRQSPWAQNTTYSQVYYLATPLLNSLAYDADIVEFVNLVARADQVK
ncbi:MAG: von Willebrand factor type A domain-containing protein [Anaerolineales bacterium]|nr:von Willebrand factor type A domain-containing protein [Anaerolineales bacterium]